MNLHTDLHQILPNTKWAERQAYAHRNLSISSTGHLPLSLKERMWGVQKKMSVVNHLRADACCCVHVDGRRELSTGPEGLLWNSMQIAPLSERKRQMLAGRAKSPGNWLDLTVLI